MTIVKLTMTLRRSFNWISCYYLLARFHLVYNFFLSAHGQLGKGYKISVKKQKQTEEQQ